MTILQLKLTSKNFCSLPYSALRIFLMVLIPLVCYFGAKALQYTLLVGSVLDSLELFPAIVGLCIFPLSVIIFSSIDGYSPISFLKAYWRQNIIGYNLWCWENGKKLMWKFQARDEYLADSSFMFITSPVLMFPLGGWLRCFGRVYWRSFDHSVHLERVYGWNLSLDMDHMTEVYVEVFDSQDSCVRLSLQNTIRFFEWLLYGGASDDWITAIPRLLRDAEHKEKYAS